jgi:hypothetical protein
LGPGHELRSTRSSTKYEPRTVHFALVLRARIVLGFDRKVCTPTYATRYSSRNVSNSSNTITSTSSRVHTIVQLCILVFNTGLHMYIIRVPVGRHCWDPESQTLVVQYLVLVCLAPHGDDDTTTRHDDCESKAKIPRPASQPGGTHKFTPERAPNTRFCEKIKAITLSLIISHKPSTPGVQYLSKCQ